MRIGRLTSMCLATVILISGCGAGSDSSVTTSTPDETASTGSTATTTVTSTPSTTLVSSDTETTMTIDPGLQPLIEQAMADLSDRLGVPESEIEVVSAELITWSDASLGCPQPGMQYAQVLTDGSQIILGHAGKDYSYHTGGSTYVPFLCENTK
jgi:hypothetical protein